jgi:hypothetical protein
VLDGVMIDPYILHTHSSGTKNIRSQLISDHDAFVRCDV